MAEEADDHDVRSLSQPASQLRSWLQATRWIASVCEKHLLHHYHYDVSSRSRLLIADERSNCSGKESQSLSSLSVHVSSLSS